MISTTPILVDLKKVNLRNGIVEICKESSDEQTQPVLSVFSDVEVRTKEIENGFSGVYAKVVERKQDEIKLRFTHSNEQLKQYITKRMEELK